MHQVPSSLLFHTLPPHCHTPCHTSIGSPQRHKKGTRKKAKVKDTTKRTSAEVDGLSSASSCTSLNSIPIAHDSIPDLEPNCNGTSLGPSTDGSAELGDNVWTQPHLLGDETLKCEEGWEESRDGDVSIGEESRDGGVSMGEESQDGCVSMGEESQDGGVAMDGSVADVSEEWEEPVKDEERVDVECTLTSDHVTAQGAEHVTLEDEVTGYRERHEIGDLTRDDVVSHQDRHEVRPEQQDRTDMGHRDLQDGINMDDLQDGQLERKDTLVAEDQVRVIPFATPPMESTSPATPPMDPTTPPMESMSPATPPEPTSPATPPMEPMSPTTPPMESTSPATPPESTSPATPPMEPTSPATPPMELSIPLSPSLSLNPFISTTPPLHKDVEAIPSLNPFITASLNPFQLSPDSASVLPSNPFSSDWPHTPPTNPFDDHAHTLMEPHPPSPPHSTRVFDGVESDLPSGHTSSFNPPGNSHPCISFPPPTVHPDSMRPDSMRPDAVRPDAVRPDAMRPDTSSSTSASPDPSRSHTTGDLDSSGSSVDLSMYLDSASPLANPDEDFFAPEV